MGGGGWGGRERGGSGQGGGGGGQGGLEQRSDAFVKIRRGGRGSVWGGGVKIQKKKKWGGRVGEGGGSGWMGTEN